MSTVDPLPTVHLMKQTKDPKSRSAVLSLVEKERDFYKKGYEDIQSELNQWNRETPGIRREAMKKKYLKNTGMGTVIASMFSVIVAGGYKVAQYDPSHAREDMHKGTRNEFRRVHEKIDRAMMDTDKVVTLLNVIKKDQELIAIQQGKTQTAIQYLKGP